jgi:hypothetical protein
MKTVLFIIIVMFMFSCKVQNTQDFSSDRYQKKLNRVTKKFIKNTSNSVLKDIQGITVRYDTIVN